MGPGRLRDPLDGGITIPVYPTYPPETVAYIARDSETRTLFVEDAAQLAKALAAAPDAEARAEIVVIDGYEAPRPSRADVGGAAAARARTGDALERGLAQRLAVDDAERRRDDRLHLRHHGPPKGVVQTHGNHLAALDMIAQIAPVREGDVHLLFLPLAHSFARMEGFLGSASASPPLRREHRAASGEPAGGPAGLHLQRARACSRRCMREILSGVAAAAARARIFHWALGVGRRARRLDAGRRPLPRGPRGSQKALADRLVFGKLRAALGGRLRFCVSGGAPLALEIAEFFHAAGILILEGYGLTETCPILASNHPDAFKFGTVGRPFPGVEIKIAEDGEILARGPNIAQGYYRKREETAAVFEPDGWFHTGDVGEIDADGFLRITDRKKDLIKTSGGSYVAPQHIENLLKGDPFVSQALVEGDRRPYPVALITLNPDELAKLARERGSATSRPGGAGAPPGGLERVRRIVDGVNAHLASYAQVKRFAVLPGDFTAGRRRADPDARRSSGGMWREVRRPPRVAVPRRACPRTGHREARGPFYRGMGVGLGSSASTV